VRVQKKREREGKRVALENGGAGTGAVPTGARQQQKALPKWETRLGSEGGGR